MKKINQVIPCKSDLMAVYNCDGVAETIMIEYLVLCDDGCLYGIELADFGDFVACDEAYNFVGLCHPENFLEFCECNNLSIKERSKQNV